MSAVLHIHVPLPRVTLDQGLNEKTSTFEKSKDTDRPSSRQIQCGLDCKKSAPGHKSNPKQTNTLIEAVEYGNVAFQIRNTA
jgi:hypothetical protein